MGAVVAAAVVVVVVVVTNDKSVSQLFSVAHRDGLSCFPIFSVRAISGKCPLPPSFLSCLVLIQVPFQNTVPRFLVLSPKLTPLVVGRLPFHQNTLCVFFLVQEAYKVPAVTDVRDLFCVTFEICFSCACYCPLNGELPKPQ